MIGLKRDCEVCDDLKNRGIIADIQNLQGTFLTEVLTYTVTGKIGDNVPLIFTIDNKYPNFKYFANEQVLREAEASGKNWKNFLPVVRFFNRKVAGNGLDLSQDYVAAWSVDVIKKFCLDSKIQIEGQIQVARAGTAMPPRIIPRYPK